MSESPFFQFYPSDWLAGTRGLTAMETGVYITLVAMMYEAEGSIQNDPKRLARLCGTSQSAFKKAVDGLLETGKLTLDERGFSNSRVEIEIKKRSEKRKVATQSANARWKKSDKNQSPENANASNSQCDSDANQKPDTRSHIDKEDPNGSLSLELSHPESKEPVSLQFERFWKEYPRREAKKAAEKNFIRAVRNGSDPEEIISGAKRYAAAMAGKDKKYMKMAEGWLSSERWTDHPNPDEDDLSPERRNHRRIIAELSGIGK